LDKKTKEQEDPMHSAVSSKLYLGIYGYKNSGWGVCGQYFSKELSGMVDLHILKKEDDTVCNTNLDGVLFQGLNSAGFIPLFTQARGRQNLAYVFFETELTLKSIQNAKRFDLVLAGSTWCRDRMRDKGIKNCDVLLQGIDPAVFYPSRQAKLNDRFFIFSGGKFELRKSQDLVLRALKIFQEKHSDVWLINSWHNIWEQSIRMMESSQHIKFEFNLSQSWKDNMLRTYLQNGLDPERIITCGPVPYEHQRQLYAQTDLGIFPNRCEGGTNLVMMEYMACGKPVIASNTSGHKDILTPDNALCLNALHDLNVVDPSGELICRWQEPALEELLAQLEFAYENRAAIAEIGKRAGEDLKYFTWKKSAQTLLELINTLQ
jgi:glycosyltransferase involved in cell wall biosynthesis